MWPMLPLHVAHTSTHVAHTSTTCGPYLHDLPSCAHWCEQSWEHLFPCVKFKKYTTEYSPHEVLQNYYHFKHSEPRRQSLIRSNMHNFQGDLTRNCQISSEIATILWLCSSFLRAPFRNPTLSHQGASKNSFWYTKLRFACHDVTSNWRNRSPNKMCYTMGNKRLSISDRQKCTAVWKIWRIGWNPASVHFFTLMCTK